MLRKPGNKRKLGRLALGFLVWTLSSSVFAVFAQGLLQQPVDFPAPPFKASGPFPREKVVEHDYTYILRRYVPPVDVVFEAKATSRSQRVPETTLASFYGAMAAGDADWFTKCWNEPSARFNAERMRKLGISTDTLRNSWKLAVENARIVLANRLEMNPFVILDYRLLRPNRPPFERHSCFTLEDGKWRVTQELATHMVPNFWKRGERYERRGVLPWPIGGAQRPEVKIPAPLHPTGPPEERTLRVETTYSYEVFRFQPPVEVLPVEKSSVSYQLPEHAAMAHISALEAADESWLAETYDKETRRVHSERQASPAGRALDPGQGTRGFEVTKGQELELTHRFQIFAYAVLVFRPRSAPLAAAPDAGSRLLVTTLEGESWRVTHALDADPLLRVWNHESKSVRLEDLSLPGGEKANKDGVSETRK